MSDSQKSQKTSFRILVATDNHIGFKEDHHIRGEDSFDAFEEILQIAKRNKVDFLLLGGDLFHELAPSQGCLYRSIRLLQKYVFGGSEVSFGTKTLAGPFPANYLNENLNIDLPIFVIHGNHDYPVSTGENISSLDLLHASRLINYIGKCKNLDEITLEPILFEKDTLRIALYGLGHIKDTRLHYLFEKKKVNFIPPPDDQYMNILILHQNRFKGIRPGVPYKNCIHPSQLPDFIDLVIWGNEHESTEGLAEDPVKNFYIYQPGSSIATSLNQSEALPKHVGFFEIAEKKNFKFVPILLRDQRRLYVKNLELDQLVGSKRRGNGLEAEKENEELEKEIEEKLEEEFNKILKEHETNLASQKKLKNPPLIRLKIEYSGFDIIRVKQAELKFMGKVANEGEVLKFWRKVVPKQVTDLKQNKKLGVDFEDTLKHKISFQTLASESNEVIKDIFEDLLQNSTQKPKVLLNFAQIVDQKFTFQGVYNQVTHSINQAKKQLVTETARETQALSKRILQRHADFIKGQYEGSQDFVEEMSVQIRDYEQFVQGIPKLLDEKLKDYNSKRRQEDIGEEEKDQKEDKKNKRQTNENLLIEEEKAEVVNKPKINGLRERENGTWGVNNDSEDEDKDWFREDFCKKDKKEEKKAKKKTPKLPAKAKSGEKGRIGRFVESCIGTDFTQRLVATSESKKKKKVFFSNVENETKSPELKELKRTKMAAFQFTQQRSDGTNVKMDRFFM